jgi:hypothetical protein
MALTVATRVQNRAGVWEFWTGGIGVSDNDTLLELALNGAIEVVLLSRAGSVDVTGSLDGTNYGSSQLALEDLTSTTPATKVVATTANKPASIKTVGYQKLKIQQAGATAASLELALRFA